MFDTRLMMLMFGNRFEKPRDIMPCKLVGWFHLQHQLILQMQVVFFVQCIWGINDHVL